MTAAELREENAYLKQLIETIANEKDRAVRTAKYMSKLVDRKTMQLQAAVETLIAEANNGNPAAISTLSAIRQIQNSVKNE